MSLKQEIETWVQALGHYDNNELEEALVVFDNIAETSKILFNCGVIHATLGEHERAVECYQHAIRLDQYLAVAYFQQGVSNFLVGDFEEALVNFNDTLRYLRGNTYIDYDQLGLKFRLYSCEVLFNRGLCYIYLQQDVAGMQDFEFAVKEKMTPDHDVIDDAIRERAEGYTVFSIPVGVVYRPNEAKVKNLKTKDYLGKARLVATSNRASTGIGFQGPQKKQALAAELAAKDDRLPENISFAATNLVQKNLTSRAGREQSAPAAMNRTVFPPTPPPESEKPQSRSSAPTGMAGRASSVRNPAPRPFHQQQNNEYFLTNARFDQPLILGRSNTIDTQGSDSPRQSGSSNRREMSSPPRFQNRPRLGTYRTASEPRGPTSRPQNPDPILQQPRPPLFRETTPQRSFEPIREDHAYEDVYDMYHTPSVPRAGHGGSRFGSFSGAPDFINEDEEYQQDIYREERSDPADGIVFDMVDSSHGKRTNMSLPRRSSSMRTDIRSIRVKVHAHEDTRYIMIGPVIEYDEFEMKIREKFGIKSKLKIKIQDEGDMITLGDQDDLDMALANAKNLARKENNEMAKMEIWIQES